MKKRGMKKIGIVLCIGLLAAMELTACGKDSGKPGTKVVFTTGAGKDEVFRIEDEVCNRQEMMVYLTTTQNQYEAVYGTQIWDTSLNA